VGNALAARTVGSANALSGGLGGAANTLDQGITLAQLLGAQNASNQQPPTANMNPQQFQQYFAN
jgi:hypothetical protein